MSPFEWAFSGKHKELDEWLSGPEGNADALCPKRKTSLLYTSSRFGRINCVKTLLEHGANPNLKNNSDDKSTPLHGSCYGGHPQIVTRLIAAGAEETTNAHGETPEDNANNPAEGVTKASGEECIKIMEKARKAAPKEPPAKKQKVDGGKPAEAAAPTKKPPAVSKPGCLDEVKAAICNGDETTVAAKATGLCQADLYEALMCIQSRSGGAIKKESVKKKLPGMARSLVSAGFDGSKVEVAMDNHILYCNWENVEIMEMLLNAGVAPPLREKRDYTYFLCMYDYAQMTRRFLEISGRDINASAESSSCTVLNYSSCLGSIKCVETLLDMKADVNKGEADDNPLLSAIQPYNGWSQRRQDLVKMLVEAKADLGRKNSEGKLPIDCMKGKCDAVKKLLKKT